MYDLNKHWHRTRKNVSLVLSYGLVIYIQYTLQPRFILLSCITQTHTHKPTPTHTDEHLRKQMFHSDRTGAIPKSYFWKSTHKHQHLVKDNWIALTKQTAITTKVCNHSRIKKKKIFLEVPFPLHFEVFTEPEGQGFLMKSV